MTPIAKARLSTACRNVFQPRGGAPAEPRVRGVCYITNSLN